MSNIEKNSLLSLIEKNKTISLYIHIPFCSTKCDYCAFYSEERSHWDKDDIVDRYLERLKKELRSVKEACKSPIFESVFIGGGNPGSLGAQKLRDLLIEIGPSKETTFEINPESFISEFPLYRSIFVDGLATRLSMGIQSMDAHTLKILNRNATKMDNFKALGFARTLTQLKIDRDDNYFLINNLYSEDEVPHTKKIEISLDLMTCLPSQTLAMATSDINYVTRVADPNHISLYCLTVEEGTRLKERVGMGDVKVMNEDEQMEHLDALWAYLKEKGYDHYEVSNFCKNNKECYHNNRYWSLSSYIGLGTHAASTLFDDNNQLVRLNNTSDFTEYVSSKEFSDYEEERIEENIQLDEYLLVALRTKKGLDKNILKNKYHISDANLAKSLLSIGKDCFLEEEKHVFLNEKGFMLLDSIVLSLSMSFDRLRGV